MEKQVTKREKDIITLSILLIFILSIVLIWSLLTRYEAYKNVGALVMSENPMIRMEARELATINF
ncbi:hypothetical protein [Halalkalibacter urbisdiaboli]|uniref:hypothetical protein n=1 Tax=Halalkalibacter urbisdiaboli TaxID=1960589 RepID=UPI000B42F27D|nr:hypothetical protein [Halalkalibacter urbisdiaboli]